MLSVTLEVGLIRTPRRADQPPSPLIVTADLRLPVAEVLMALWLGKLLKYTPYARLTSTLPECALRHGAYRAASLYVAQSHATIRDVSNPPPRAFTP